MAKKADKEYYNIQQITRTWGRYMNSPNLILTLGRNYNGEGGDYCDANKSYDK